MLLLYMNLSLNTKILLLCIIVITSLVFHSVNCRYLNKIYTIVTVIEVLQIIVKVAEKLVSFANH